MTLFALDSSVLLEIALGGEPTVAKTRALLKDGPEPVVSWMALYELAYVLTRKGKNPERYIEDLIARTRLVGWSNALLSAATQARLQNNLKTADSVIYATAVTQGATLLTRDSDFKGLPGVQII